MTLDALLRTVHKRKVQHLFRLTLPLPYLLILGTVLFAGAGYFWVGSVFGMIAGLPEEAVVRGAFVLGLFFSLLPVTFSFIRSSTLRNDLNESLVSLPVSAGQWIRRTTRYYYLSQSPIYLGIFIGIAAGLMFKTDISYTDAFGLLLAIAMITMGTYFAANKLTALMLHKYSVFYFSLVSLGFISLVAAIILFDYKFIFRSSASGSLWQASELPAVSAALLSCLTIGYIAGRYARRYDASPIPFRDDGVMTSPLRRGKPRTRKYNLFKVIITVIIRDKKAWTIILVNLLLFLMGLMLATKADSASYNTFLVSFMPTLLIIGVASVLAEVRGSLGASRISIYYLPITPSKLISNLTLAGVVFGLLSVTLLAGVTQKIITGSIDWQSLSRLSITMALAIQAAVLASVLFFESKRDIGKGILAGIAMFILTWPILLGSEWIRQKGLPVYLAASALTAIMIFYVTVHADKKLQSERFA